MISKPYKSLIVNKYQNVWMSNHFSQIRKSLRFSFISCCKQPETLYLYLSIQVWQTVHEKCFIPRFHCSQFVSLSICLAILWVSLFSLAVTFAWQKTLRMVFLDSWEYLIFWAGLLNYDQFFGVPCWPVPAVYWTLGFGLIIELAMASIVQAIGAFGSCHS